MACGPDAWLVKSAITAAGSIEGACNCRARQHDCGAGRIHQALQLLSSLARLEVYVAGTGLQCCKYTDDQINRAFETQGNTFAGADSLRLQAVSQLARLRLELLKVTRRSPWVIATAVGAPAARALMAAATVRSRAPLLAGCSQPEARLSTALDRRAAAAKRARRDFPPRCAAPPGNSAAAGWPCRPRTDPC